MHDFNFALLAVLRYVALIGTTPLGARRTPADDIDRRQKVCRLTTSSGEVLIRLKSIFSSPPTISCGVTGLEVPDFLACLYCDANPTDLYCEELCAYDDQNPFCTPTVD